MATWRLEAGVSKEISKRLRERQKSPIIEHMHHRETRAEWPVGVAN